MLKRLSRLLLGLGIVVCAGSACVTPTHASSAFMLPSDEAGIILTHVYPAAEGGATHELVALFNTTDFPVDITGWCLTNSAAKPLACFKNEHGDTYRIEPRGRVVVASKEYVGALPIDRRELIDVTYAVASKTSGSLVGSSDTVLLKDAVGRVAAEWSWASALAKGLGYIRNGFDEEGGNYNEMSKITSAPLAFVVGGGLSIELNESPEVKPERGGLLLNEALPDPKGADTGSEFIELYNPQDTPVDLSDYTVRISGGSTEKAYQLAAGAPVEPGEYRVVTNHEIKYSLNNTQGSVALEYQGEVEDFLEYRNPAEGSTWAYSMDTQDWMYTATPTPGTQNIITAAASVTAVTVQKPCSEDQFRNPATGRCKKKEAPKAPIACKPGQERNPETGRCRNVAATKKVAACKSGQERNPATQRCRNIKKMTSAGSGIESKLNKTSGGVMWYAWLAVGLIVAGILAYGVWEWRTELQRLWLRVRKQEG